MGERRPSWAALVVVLLAACTAAPLPSQSPSATIAPTPAATAEPTATPLPTPDPGDLPPILQALRYAPAGVTAFDFTDWAQLKAEAGFPDLTSSATDEEFSEFLHALVGDAVANTPSPHYPRSELASLLRGMAPDLGFNATDLEWEAYMHAAGNPPGLVVRFADHFDLQVLLARFDQVGYAVEDGPKDAVVYRLSLGSPALGPYLFMANVAVLADRRTLVLSTRPEALDGLLPGATDPSVAATDRATFEAAAAGLDGPTAANLQRGEPLCELLHPDAPYLSDVVRAEIAAAAPLHAYEVVGIGYSRAHDPIGSIVFAYADEADAAADLPGRRELAAGGHSIENPDVSYSERFTLVDAVSEGPLLVLRLAPYLDSASFLMGSITRRDLSFAACAG